MKALLCAHLKVAFMIYNMLICFSSVLQDWAECGETLCMR